MSGFPPSILIFLPGRRFEPPRAVITPSVSMALSTPSRSHRWPTARHSSAADRTHGPCPQPHSCAGRTRPSHSGCRNRSKSRRSAHAVRSLRKDSVRSSQPRLESVRILTYSTDHCRLLQRRINLASAKHQLHLADLQDEFFQLDRRRRHMVVRTRARLVEREMLLDDGRTKRNRSAGSLPSVSRSMVAVAGVKTIGWPPFSAAVNHRRHSEHVGQSGSARIKADTMHHRQRLAYIFKLERYLLPLPRYFS